METGTGGGDTQYRLAEWAALADATYMLPALADLGVNLNQTNVPGLVLTVVMQVRAPAPSPRRQPCVGCSAIHLAAVATSGAVQCNPRAHLGDACLGHLHSPSRSACSAAAGSPASRRPMPLDFLAKSTRSAYLGHLKPSRSACSAAAARHRGAHATGLPGQQHVRGITGKVRREALPPPAEPLPGALHPQQK